ncbi:class III lanthionine synthetase LanKC [Kitasatospora sp. CB02891]|uniref:class III lanthionine synthetase LanKC n=1 Tax=Kitasatospora sp. CB02891 TaxID=2020329 RepID=UPI000C27B63A|nr:class III lanthionine synthetase LanKC [Kitasatospora sp. CB02891]PJN27845.1 serine/threonine protein kinase [Kitasatospora sp. CB02891]
MAETLAEFIAADPDYYAPMESAAPEGPVLAPSRPADGWQGTTGGIWTMWHREGMPALPEDGWKVHVSARRSRTGAVLDTVAGICFAQDVAFKHLSTDHWYWWLHRKHGSRPQSGKFIAAYPVDVEAARRLMEALREALDGEQGPLILSDRRYPGSETVQYRYGAYSSRDRLEAEGTRTSLTVDANGRAVPDLRGVSFQLPEGFTDPFALDLPAPAAGPAGPVVLNGFAIEATIAHSSGGSAYEAVQVATGRRAFIKEARPFHGLSEGEQDAVARLHDEWRTLTTLHDLAPGLAPEPIALFKAGGHEFMATEFVEGSPITRVVTTGNPLLMAGTGPAEHAAYYARCEQILGRIEDAMDRLHALGWTFMDVSPTNVIVTPEDGIRLIDFETAIGPDGTPGRMGTPGFSPPKDVVDRYGRTAYDDYGVSGLTQVLLGCIPHTTEQNPDTLAHFHCDLAERTPAGDVLWKRATRYHPPSEAPALPSPEEVAADPLRHLADLRDAVAAGILAAADPEHPLRTFPTVPEGHATNTLCVAYGAAGVLHALHRCGVPAPDGALERLRREALADADRLAPGLHVGLAGIAWVLAEHGLLDEARSLLDTADAHPLVEQSATLFGGAAGLAMGHLALHRRTGDAHHAERAHALLTAQPDGEELVPRLGRDDATGLLHGRAGLALAYQQFAQVTGDTSFLAQGVRLLHAELDRATDPDAAGLLFPVSTEDKRAMPYLYCGSAGLVHVATRYLRTAEDGRLADAMPRLLAPLHGTFTALPALFAGTAGYAFTLAEHGLLAGDETSRTGAVRAARALYKHAVPKADSVRFLGTGLQRFSTELWSGSAGVLLALDQVLAPRPDLLFTLDTPAK